MQKNNSNSLAHVDNHSTDPSYSSDEGNDGNSTLLSMLPSIISSSILPYKNGAGGGGTIYSTLNTQEEEDEEDEEEVVEMFQNRNANK